jgi:hypothetical protein
MEAPSSFETPASPAPHDEASGESQAHQSLCYAFGVKFVATPLMQ